jgi:cation diffusion facilitator CzcD-associated flavoprotein CzcO
MTDEQRLDHFESMWKRGGFNFHTCGFDDVARNPKSNRVVYDFWAKKTRARMTDPVKRDLMAPLEPPYYFGTKRLPLERDYYESLDQPNVEIVDLNATPLDKFTEKGILTSDGKEREFDVVALATGFESFTGS